jgi:hypothetical protein
VDVAASGITETTVPPLSSVELSATAVYDDGTKADITKDAEWTSSDASVVKIVQRGQILAAAEGRAIISASRDKTGTLALEVRRGGCETSTISPLSLAAYSNGDPYTMFIVTPRPDCAWSIRSDVAWLTGLSPSSGAGLGLINYRVDGNPYPQRRAGRVIVGVGGRELTLSVTQERAPCASTVTPSHFSFPSSGGHGEFDVTTDPPSCSFQAGVGGGSTGLNIRIISGESGVGRGHVVFVVGPNGSTVPARSFADVRTPTTSGLSNTIPIDVAGK